MLATRARALLSQGQFAAALSISVRTLQHWDQGRRQPSGAAATLLKIIARHPELLLETLARRSVVIAAWWLSFYSIFYYRLWLFFGYNMPYVAG